ncbi:MAG: glycosyltransferase family 39 protein [Nitrospirota bacterium]|nr:glycosyltransferase family 39 protein [Nitrospirota bacterium]
MPGKRSLRETYPSLFIAFCTLTTFFLQYTFRSLDDNRLTSWKWAFSNIDPMLFALLIVTGLATAFMISGLLITKQRPALFLFVCSFALSAIFWQEPEVIVDASRYFTQAKHLELHGAGYFFREWGSSINAWTDMPLMPLMYGLTFKLFGETRLYIQALTAFMFSMTVVITYLTGKALWDEDTGFFAGALILGIPYIFSQVPLMLVDVPVMFFLTLSLFTFIMALEKGGAWTAGSALSISCAFFSKYSAWLMLSILPVTFLVYLLTNRRGALGAGRGITDNGLRQIILRAVYVVLFAGMVIGAIVYLKYDVISAQIAFLQEYQAPGLKRWGETFTSTFLFQTHPFITLAALYSVYEAARKKDLKFLIISWLILLIVLLQIKRSRYVMVAFPMLALMASYGLRRIKSIEMKRYIVFCAAAASIITAVFAFLPLLNSMELANLKHAGGFLDSIRAGRVEVYTVSNEETSVNPAVAVPLLDLFTDKDIVYHHDSSFSLPFNRTEKSPLRFTWEYKNPAYYMPDEKNMQGSNAIAIISNKGNRQMPEGVEERLKGYKEARLFDASTGIFRYSPAVAVYLPNDQH